MQTRTVLSLISTALLAGCISAPKPSPVASGPPPLPVRTKPVTHRAPESVYVPPVRQWQLAWDYVAPVPESYVFEIWWAPNLNASFQFFLQTTNLQTPIQLTNRSGFYRCRVKDTATGLYSDWATTK